MQICSPVRKEDSRSVPHRARGRGYAKMTSLKPKAPEKEFVTEAAISAAGALRTNRGAGIKRLLSLGKGPGQWEQGQC